LAIFPFLDQLSRLGHTFDTVANVKKYYGTFSKRSSVAATKDTFADHDATKLLS
jgi:hypothetical protein